MSHPNPVRLVAALFIALSSAIAQQNSGATVATASVVPRLVSYGGALKDANGKPISNITGVTFLIYRDQQGGSPLWLETQNIVPDKNGRYSVQLGAVNQDGLPPDVFMTGEARWLGVQIGTEPEQPRVLLVAVPYAMKAADAETVGGLPPSAFVLAAPAAASNTTVTANAPGTVAANSASVVPPPSSNVTTSGGTANTISMFTTGTNVQNSILTQMGTTALNVGGQLNLPTTGTATATKGFNSRPLDFVASAFNSSTNAAVAQTFQWRTEPSGNNTSSPSGTLNLLFGSGTTSPTETGLKISNKGLFKFATGQTFPGAGTLTGVTTASSSGLTGGGTSGTLSLSLLKSCAPNQILQWNGATWACANAGAGTITGVTTASGSGLIGGGTSGTLSLSLPKTCSTNQLMQWNGANWVCATISGSGTITGVTAGTDLTGGGTSGSITLNLDTTKVPQLSSTNSFGAAQAITSNASSADALTITNKGSGAGINITTANGPAVFANASGVGNTGIFGSGGLGGIGVNGFSTNSTGVFGNSTTGNGVAGQTGGSTIGTAGVYGVAGTASAVGGGIAGVWGTSVTNVGVFGNSTNQTGAVGQSGSGNGVAGYTTSTTNSGVAGINAAAGPGVYGHSTGGFGFVTDSNVNQDRLAGGWVKAMAFVDPFAQGGIAVTRCFNSQQTGAAVSAPPCGISITHLGLGQNLVDFGFEVDDRFVLLTNAGSGQVIHTATCALCTSVNQKQVFSWDTLAVDRTDEAFFIVVF